MRTTIANQMPNSLLSAIILVILTMMVQPTKASDNPPSISYLEQTPVSRLELGFLRWQEDLEEFVESMVFRKAAWAVPYGASAYVYYDQEITRVVLIGNLANPNATELHCLQFVSDLRERFGSDVRFGDPMKSYFGSRSWDKPPPVESLAESLANLVDIKCKGSSVELSRPLVKRE